MGPVRILANVLGIVPAHAASLPAGYQLKKSGCADYLDTPKKVSNWDLFTGVKGATWKGCVEARKEPFDTDDKPPSTGNKNTLWVPYFWPDETDKYESWVYSYKNDYMSDAPFVKGTMYGKDWEPAYHEGHIWRRAWSTLKYDGIQSATIDEIAPDTLGPNKACPDPILPLTNNYGAVTSKINSLMHWEGGGTMTNVGAVWGWRTLSPTAPFTEGRPYGEVTKVLLLMTDGENQMLANDVNGPTKSQYTAYGYLRDGRFKKDWFSEARIALNDKLLDVCKNAKKEDVVIYVVTFGLNDPDTRKIYDNCATEKSYAYHIDTASELSSAFKAIARSVAELRLAK